MQLLWIISGSWDDPLLPDLAVLWIRYYSELYLVEWISILRRFYGWKRHLSLATCLFWQFSKRLCSSRLFPSGNGIFRTFSSCYKQDYSRTAQACYHSSSWDLRSCSGSWNFTFHGDCVKSAFALIYRMHGQIVHRSFVHRLIAVATFIANRTSEI